MLPSFSTDFVPSSNPMSPSPYLVYSSDSEGKLLFCLANERDCAPFLEVKRYVGDSNRIAGQALVLNSYILKTYYWISIRNIKAHSLSYKLAFSCFCHINSHL